MREAEAGARVQGAGRGDRRGAAPAALELETRSP